MLFPKLEILNRMAESRAPLIGVGLGLTAFFAFSLSRRAWEQNLARRRLWDRRRLTLEGARRISRRGRLRKTERALISLVSSEIGREVLLRFLQSEDLVALSSVSKTCYFAASADEHWQRIVLVRLKTRCLPRLDCNSAEIITESVIEAFQAGFFRNLPVNEAIRDPKNAPPRWKSFFSVMSCLCKTTCDEYGDAVIIPRDYIGPHHIFRLAHLISIRKDPSFVPMILNKFLTLYKSLDGRFNLQDNAGFVFSRNSRPKFGSPSASTPLERESVSHKDFTEICRTCNLQFSDLVQFFECQHKLLF